MVYKDNETCTGGNNKLQVLYLPMPLFADFIFSLSKHSSSAILVILHLLFFPCSTDVCSQVQYRLPKWCLTGLLMISVPLSSLPATAPALSAAQPAKGWGSPPGHCVKPGTFVQLWGHMKSLGLSRFVKVTQQRANWISLLSMKCSKYR